MVLPVRETSDEPDAPATKIDNCPVTSPAAFGAKITVIVELCPGVRVKAANGAERAKPGPVTTILLTVTLPPLVSEELVTITEACRLSFTATAPKSRLAAERFHPQNSQTWPEYTKSAPPGSSVPKMTKKTLMMLMRMKK